MLENTGDKAIITDEYVHNFMSLNGDAIGRDYILKFPFQVRPDEFGETINPENKVEVNENEVKFNSSIDEEFFFSKLSGDTRVAASWELIHLSAGVRITEKGSFRSKKVNLWGCKHVISPELFFDVFVNPGQAIRWFRTYEFDNF
jgi:hypothetical protein